MGLEEILKELGADVPFDEDGELARQSKFEDYETEGCEYSEDDVWVETECDE